MFSKSICVALVSGSLVLGTLVSAPIKKLAAIKKLYISSIKLNATCSENIDIVKFPDINFVGETFLTSLVSNFKRKNKFVELEYGRYIEDIIDYRKKIIYSPHWIYFENNFDLERLTEEDRNQIATVVGTPYELELDLRTSLWAQRIIGVYRIYRDGKKLYSASVQAISTYIIKDKDSPYITDYDDDLDDFQNPLDHRGEIKKIYAELGSQIGNSLRLLFVEKDKKIIKKKKKKKKNLENQIGN